MARHSVNTYKIMNAMNDWKNKHFNVYSPDNWVISNDTQTLTGEPFISLYDGVEYSTETHKTDEGTEIEILNISDKPYRTEMMYGDLMSSESTQIEAMDPKKRVAYEVTLLSKQYANKAINANASDRAAIEQEYADKMRSYNAYCEANNISWTSTMYIVSSELQHESLEYTTDSKHISDPSTAGKNATNANIAHRLQLAQAGPDFVDVPIPQLAEQDVTYEDTLSSTPIVKSRTDNIFGNIKNSFQKFFDWIKDFHPIKSLSVKTNEYVASVSEAGEYLSEDFNEKHGIDGKSNNPGKYFDMAKDMFGDVITGKDIASEDYSQYQ